MYMLRRVYKAKYRQGKFVASLVRKQQDIYESAGRSEGTVYFNAGTVPGEPDSVVLEWTQDTLGSPYLSGGGASLLKRCKSVDRCASTSRVSTSSFGNS